MYTKWPSAIEQSDNFLSVFMFQPCSAIMPAPTLSIVFFHFAVICYLPVAFHITEALLFLELTLIVWDCHVGSAIYLFIIFTAHCKASFASAVYATAYLSVRPSVTLQYCVKTRERRGIQSSSSCSPVSLVFWCQEWLMGDDCVQVKFECK